MNATIKKFGYPDLLLKEYDYWVILLRPDQVTLSSLIIACKEDKESFSDISISAHNQLKIVIHNTENVLKSVFQCNKINYLALMMVDKHVHFHVIPRYSRQIEFNKQSYQDRNWPKAPILSDLIDMTTEQFQALKLVLVSKFNDVL